MRLIDADAFKVYMRGALEQTRRCYPDGGEWAEAVTEEFCRDIDEQPSAQPELTDEQSIAHLQSSGWMQRHDKEMYESGLKKQLADDSDSYDSLLPAVHPEVIRCEDCKHWIRQTNYQGAPLSFGFCESEDMWASLYGETTEVEHIDTDDNHYCGYARRRGGDSD